MALAGRHLLIWLLIVSIIFSFVSFPVSARSSDYETYTFAFSDTKNIGTLNEQPVYKLVLDGNTYDKIDFLSFLTEAVVCTALLKDASQDGSGVVYKNGDTSALLTYGDAVFTAVQQFYADNKNGIALDSGNAINESGSILLFRLLQAGRPPQEKGYLLIEWSKPSSSAIPEVDKSVLSAVIAIVWDGNEYSKEYYRDNDRYNGKYTITNKNSGFWLELIGESGPLSHAQAIHSRDDAIQAEVDSAVAELSSSINKLIPITQINATELYEAIHETYYWWNNTWTPASQLSNPTGMAKASASNCTSASWQAYQDALNIANAELAKLFDSDGNATAYNQSGGETETEAEKAVNAALTGLKAAVNGLDHLADSSDLLNAQYAFKQLTVLTRRIFNASALNENTYTEDSWSVFQTAVTAANAFLSQHSTPADSIGKREAQEYRDAYTAFWQVCFDRLAGKSAGSATVHIVDNYALRKGGTPYAKTGTYSVSVPAGGVTLDNALKTAIGSDYSFPWNDAGRGVGVYLNGVYLLYTVSSVETRPDSSPLAYRDVMLKAGDTVLISLMAVPTGANLSGSVTVTPFSEIHEFIRYIQYSQNGSPVSEVSAVAGSELKLTANTFSSSLMDYSGTASPLSGASVYVSSAYSTREAVLGASADQDTGIVTGADGSFTLMLTSAQGVSEGWYKVNLLAEGKNGGLTNGIDLLIHVTDPSDLSGLKQELEQRLEEAYTAYDDSFYTEAQRGQIETLYAEGNSGIERASTSGDADAAYQTAYDGITAIQSANEKALTFNLNAVQELLACLPSEEDLDAGKLYDVDKPLLDLLFSTDGWYTRMTEFQKSSFTGSEAALLGKLKTAYENADNGNTLPAIPAFTVKIEVRNAQTSELVDLPLKDDGNYSYLTVTSFNEENGHFQWRYGDTYNLTGGSEAGTYLLPTGGNYILELNIGVNCGDYSVYDYDRWSAESFASDIPEHYLFENNSITLFHTLRQDVTVIRYVNAVDPVQNARDSALKALKIAYQQYSRSDYSEENWSKLSQAYQSGTEAIQSAADETAAQTALNNAKAAMAAVEKQTAAAGSPIPGWGAGDAFDAGKQVGTVSLSVENSTFPGGAFYNGGDPLFEEPAYPIGENDTMMTVILRALADEGYSWDDGSTGGFGISYIANIIEDGQKMGQFSGETGSGWMGSLNDFLVDEGFPGFSVANGQLADGDEVKLMFTQNLGVDLGGSWGNSNTTLKSLKTSAGTIVPVFTSGEAGGNYDFALLITSDSAGIRFTPTAANKNYLVKIFLNEKVTSNVEGNSFYKRTETVPVRAGDIVYIGVGERTWPSMNKSGAEARVYDPTWYALHIITADDGVDYVNERIAALPAAKNVSTSNYQAVQAQIAAIDAVNAVLSASEQARVNTEALEAVREIADGYEAIMALKTEIKALPSVITASDKTAVNDAKTHYDALTAAQKNLLTVAETNNILKAVNTLAVIDALDAIKETYDFPSTKANTQGTVKTALEAEISNSAAEVAMDSGFTPAADGTAENLDGTEGSYSATVTVTIGTGAVMASGEKTVTGKIIPEKYVKSSDAGVQSVTVSGVAANGTGTAYTATLPYGSDRAKATFEIVPAAKATASKPTTSNKGETWTFTVTAEDGVTTKTYTVTLSVSEVEAVALESWVYAIGGDTKPVAVTNLVQAVNLDQLDLPEGTKKVSLWLELKETAANTYDLAALYAYSPKGTEARAVPAAALTGKITLTLPVAGTEYTRVLYNGAYLEAKGDKNGVTFTAAAAGSYTLIPDAHVTAVTFHLNGGKASGLQDGETVVYLLENDGDALPVPEKSGYTFKGWHGDSSVSSTAYTAVSNALPADLYALWQSRDVNAEVTAGGVQAEKSGVVFTVTLPYGSKYPKAAEIVVTPEDSAATASKPMTGDDGVSWSFTVTAEDGTKKEYTLQVVIAEQTAEDILAAAKQTLADQSWDTDQRTANDAASLKTFVEGKLKGLDLGGAAYTVTIDSVTPAKAGDEQNTQGTAGSYRFTVTLSSGGKSESVNGSGNISAAAYVAPAQLADYEKALQAVEAYLKANVTNPDVGSTEGEWVVFALNRGGVAEAAWNDVYLENLKTYLDETDGILAEKNYTEYSRVILALTSMGVDASGITTDKRSYDLVSHLLDKQDNGDYWAEWQGNNGTAFALLAMDSHDYLNTAAGKAARAALIASLKANQQESGAWAIEGKGSPDLDVTAAAVYALAPYYLDSAKLTALGVSAAEVKAMVDNALAYLSDRQNADGGFGSVEADVWAIIALSSLGRDADTDPAFVKNGKSLLADILTYRNESTGAFRHLASGSDNQMGTEQAAYGLVAYDRFKKNQNTLYDMSDVKFATAEEKADRAAAEAVEERIDAIGEVTLESKAKIDAARAAYNALTDEQKALVGNLAVLEAAEKKYKELTESAGKEEVDRAAAKGVDDLIDAIGAVSLSSESDIQAARAAYDALTDEQKALVTKTDALKAAEAKLASLKADKAAAKAVDNLIGAIGEVTKESEAAIKAARAAYDFLTETQKQQVTKLPALIEAEWKWELLYGDSQKDDDGKLHVTMRLIGAELASKDVDLGKEAYLPNYVTWIPTTQYAVEEGTTVYDLWALATWQYGIKSVGAEKNYVATVYSPSGYALSEFTNGRRSGWMYTINGRHPGFGLKEQPLHDGDMIVWHYVSDYAYEVADWVSEGAWQALGDGTYYNRWLLAPDYFGGWGGGINAGTDSDPGSGSESGSGVNPNQVSNVVTLKAEMEATGAYAILDEATTWNWLQNTTDQSVMPIRVDSGIADRIVIQLEAIPVIGLAMRDTEVRLDTPKGTVILDPQTMDTLAENGNDVRVIIEANRNGTTTIRVNSGSRPADVDVKIELQAPYNGQVLVMVNQDGTEEVIKKSYVENGKVYAVIPAGATVKVADNGKTFGDVKVRDWYADAVEFVSSHELFQGVGENIFDPQASMTRAMLVTVLYRLENEPESSGKVKFADVAEDTWYADAVAWAAEMKLVNGTDKGFEPNADITREQIATILYRYAQSLGMDTKARGIVSRFGDGAEISGWAADAMAWAVEVGLFRGDENENLNPQGNATRAEVATLLERLVKLIVK